MRHQYIVLQPLSPEQGPLILPSAPDRDTPDVIPPPTLVDDTVISAEAAPILIALGVIALVEAPAPETPDLLPSSSSSTAEREPEPEAPRRRKP